MELDGQVDRLRLACESGDLERIQALSSEMKPIEWLDLAVREELFDCGELILQSGVDIDQSYGCGWTLLHQNVRNPRAVEFLLGCGAGAQVSDYEDNFPLAKAAELLSFLDTQEQAIQSIDLLIAAGARSDICGREGTSLLHCIASYFDLEQFEDRDRGLAELGRLIQVAMDSGCDVNAQDDDEFEGGDTALHYAAESLNAPVVSSLLDTGADPFALNRRFRRPLDLVLEGPESATEKKAVLEILEPATPWVSEWQTKIQQVDELLVQARKLEQRLRQSGIAIAKDLKLWKLVPSNLVSPNVTTESLAELVQERDPELFSRWEEAQEALEGLRREHKALHSTSEG